MKGSWKVLLMVMVASFVLALAGCGASGSGAEGEYIIEAGKVAGLLAEGNAVLVDMQATEDYAKAHVTGAVNITRGEIMINQPIANMLAPKENIEQVMGKNGISNNTMVIAYDNTGNMDAARLWWTLLVYGHENVKVVSGGLKALQAAGMELTAEQTPLTAVAFAAQDKNTALIATRDEVLAQVNEPKQDIVLLDTRTREEFEEGTISGSILYDYAKNNNSDGTYKSKEAIIMQYNDLGIKPEKTIIMYCKTSVRAAQTYLALYNAGYRNLKLYDGAWLEWSADKSLPAQMPTGNKVEPSNSDNS